MNNFDHHSFCKTATGIALNAWPGLVCPLPKPNLIKIGFYLGALAVSGCLYGQGPQAPSQLAVIPESGSHFLLGWNDESEDEEGFRIERRKNKEWEAVGVVPANATTFASTGCLPFTQYEHRVVAFNKSGENSSETAIGKTFNLLSHRRCGIVQSGSVRQGEGSFVLLPNGNLVLYYSDMVTVSDLAEAQVSKIVSLDLGQTWSERIVVFHEPGMALFLPCALRLNNGDIALSYVRRVPGEWFSQRVIRLSRDGAETWSEEQVVTDESFDYSTGSHDRIYQLSNGDVILLVHSAGNGGGRGGERVTDVYASSDNGKSWEKRTKDPLRVSQNPYDMAQHGFWECAMAELEDGELLLVGRNATGWLYGTRSHDYGRSWKKPENYGIQNPLAPPYLKKIDGTQTLILLNNPILPAPDNVFGQRYVLGSRISHDGGRTWSNFKEIENHTHNWWYDYPNMLQDGNVMHLSYRAIEMTPPRLGSPASQAGWGRVNLAYLKLPVNWFLE